MRVLTVLCWVALLAVLAPAVVLTVNRFVEPSWGPAIRAEAFTPLGLPLYAAALTGLAVALVLADGNRGPLVAVAVLCALGLGVHAWWWSPEVLGGDPAPPATADRLVVMTANLFEGRGDTGQLVAAVRDADADILVVEEITHEALADLDAAGLPDLLPYRAGSPGDAVEGTMVFARRPVGATTRLGTNLGSWEVEVGPVTVLAVHPAAPTLPDAWRDDHATILAATRATRPDLVVGDLNATDDHAPLRALADAGWRDAARLAHQGWQPTWPAHGLFSVLGIPLPPVTRIDHVLVGPGWSSLGTRTVTIDGTDHRAVVAEVARS